VQEGPVKLAPLGSIERGQHIEAYVVHGPRRRGWKADHFEWVRGMAASTGTT
jgi:hypothetical protein